MSKYFSDDVSMKITIAVTIALTLIVSVFASYISPILIVSVFAPSLAYLIFVWRKEKVEREPLIGLLMAFSYGFILCTFLALVVESFIATIISEVLLVVFIGPVIEEISKFMGVQSIAKLERLFNEVDDGIVYGASIGLGFATLETILYTFRGKEPLLIGVLRSISSTAGHSASSAIAGWGYALTMFGGHGPETASRFLFIAILLHVLHNLLAVFAIFQPVLLLAAIVLDLYTFYYITSRVE
ncbi:MAG: PrsW family intramembrane metalloprotease [archaeon GB-1867-035]|nr:PrsW family intramembrane metalloprotease [Candidatus Culexmicrobium profundum]